MALKPVANNAKSVNPNVAPQRIDRDADGTPRRLDLTAPSTYAAKGVFVASSISSVFGL
ncbi:MAG: hypothetical protein SGJ09_08950 [Phycisphaerae bacterium]|nr:hypothetical protein [Phycisphaerae bacterium]